MTLPAPSIEMPVPLKRRTRGGAAQELREELEVPSGTRLQYTPVSSDIHGEVTHVAAFRPLQLTEGELTGVRLMVPAVAEVRTRGRSVTGVIGEIRPANQQIENEGRAFARALLANGDIRTVLARQLGLPSRRVVGRAARGRVERRRSRRADAAATGVCAIPADARDPRRWRRADADACRVLRSNR